MVAILPDAVTPSQVRRDKSNNRMPTLDHGKDDGRSCCPLVLYPSHPGPPGAHEGAAHRSPQRHRGGTDIEDAPSHTPGALLRSSTAIRCQPVPRMFHVKHPRMNDLEPTSE